MLNELSRTTQCFTAEQLAMYFADELAPVLLDVVEDHLATCEACSILAEDIAECTAVVASEGERGHVGTSTTDAAKPVAAWYTPAEAAVTISELSGALELGLVSSLPFACSSRQTLMPRHGSSPGSNAPPASPAVMTSTGVRALASNGAIITIEVSTELIVLIREWPEQLRTPEVLLFSDHDSVPERQRVSAVRSVGYVCTLGVPPSGAILIVA